MKEENKPKCEECGTTVDVTYAPNPFQYEIHGIEINVWMCEVCRQASAMEI